MERTRELPYGEVRSCAKKRCAGREPYIAVNLARRARNSSESGSSDRVQGLVT